MESLVKLIDYLEENGYSQSYINAFRREIRVILGMRGNKSWVSYDDLCEKYCSRGYKSATFSKKKRLLSLIAKFETRNIYPVNHSKSCDFKENYLQKDSLKKLSPEFQGIILNYVSTQRNRGLRESTITGAFCDVSLFLRHMQDSGLTMLSEIREEHVLDFFFSQGERQKRGYTCKRHIKKALEYYAEKDPESCGVAVFLPDIKYSRKNIQYLTQEEISKIKLALNDHNNALDYRDRAVGVLLLYTGLRRSDVANLKLEDIRWKEDAITFYQQKTGAGLTLPLRPVVGNAIYDYVQNERPRVAGGNLFLAKPGPHKGVSAEMVSVKIVRRIFDAAGVRLDKGDRRGSHLFRHHLAISLLENDVPQPVISTALGHGSPQSTETYLNADFAHLKECAIDISNYPISEEVFDV